MAARARRNRDQACRALFNSFAGKAVINHVVHRHTAPSGDSGVQVFARAKRGDDDGHLPLFARHHVLFPTVVGLVDDLVDGIGCRRKVRIVAIPRGQFFGDLVDPLIQLRLRARVEGRERSDNPGLALGNDQLGTRYDEEGGADDRQAEAVEYGWDCHGPVL